MIVVDASAMTEWLLQTEIGSRVEARLVRDGDAFHAPHLIDAEVVRALRRLVRTGDVSAPRAGEAVNDLTLLQVTRHPHVDLLGRVWQLRDNVSAYDGTYVALAEALDATLVTCDGPLGTAPGHTARVEVIH